MTYWLSDTFKHRRRETTHEVAFWSGNSASEEKDATHASVIVHRGCLQKEISFQWPQEKASVDALEAMLRRAFEIGRRDAKREVCHVLGIRT